jgi:hypothetical protein
VLNLISSQLNYKGVFGWAVAFEKTIVGCELWKSSCEKAVVGKAEGRLVKGAVKL